MSKLRTVQRTLAVSGVTLALAATGALGTAQAADIGADASAPTAVRSNGSGKISVPPLPNCIDVDVDGRTARVYNWCSTTKWVKVKWSLAPDSPCTDLKPDHVLTSKRNWPARFDGVVLCA
ncbi:hypothetical protein [Streptomyces sp. G45]|uniref:hypothetical protein n=1 Tax=Streptomyces sp. G45 TaxID=3406627 RepID=UPI003C1DB8C4